MSSTNNDVTVMNEFNASISATELLTKTLENMAKELAIRCITECASMYKFDAVDAIVALGLQNLTLTRKPMHKKTVDDEPTVKKLIVKEPKPVKDIKEPKSTFPFPFDPSRVNLSGCQGISYNHGLFTQCVKSCMATGSFCKSCQTEADNSATGRPDCGTVAQRIDTDLYEFKDSKGRNPTSYTKFLEKAKLTAVQAVEEAGKLQFIINDCHFLKQVNKEDSQARGRPKKIVAPVQAETVEDMFANLECDDQEVEEVEVEEVEVKEVEEEAKQALLKATFEAEREARRAKKNGEKNGEKKKTVKKAIDVEDEEVKKLELEAQKEADKEAKKVALEAKKLAAEADKEAKKVALEAEKEAKKQAIEAEKEAKKVALEAEKEAKKVALEAEKEAKKLAAEAEKEAKKLAAEAEKEAKKLAVEVEKAEKEAKKLAIEADKEAKKQALEAKKQELEVKKQAIEAKKLALETKQLVAKPVTNAIPVANEIPAKKDIITVKEITIKGQQYLRSRVSNIVYSLDREEVGIWNEETKDMDPLPETGSEEEEEEYEDEEEEEDEGDEKEDEGDEKEDEEEDEEEA